MTIIINYIDTPIGVITAGATDKGLCLLLFGKIEVTDFKGPYSYKKGNHQLIEKLAIQLRLYFNKKRTIFDISLDLQGTPFQINVWRELLTIDYGTTRSYKEQALALGNLKAIRAVATANGSNKIAIVIPCHRIIGSNGELTGYSGGLWRKKYLLDLESNQAKLF